jgi:hypothetical protein
VTKETQMKRCTDETPTTDATVSMLDSLHDGSLAGLAQYHLLKMQLDAIRNLPEAPGRDGVASGTE